jgi:hypothetical protein
MYMYFLRLDVSAVRFHCHNTWPQIEQNQQESLPPFDQTMCEELKKTAFATPRGLQVLGPHPCKPDCS